METRLFVRYFILVVAILAFIYSAFFSSSGITRYFKAKHDITIENQKIARLEKKVKKLNKSIKGLSKDGFELEKLARQDLQMGSQGETVYLLPA